MTVAWIGNREARHEDAAAEAARILSVSQCPVILMDTDVHGVRAAIALADRVGAAVDLADGEALMREVRQLADRGMMVMSPPELRRRADLLVFVGPLPRAQDDLVADLVASAPDLSGGRARSLFSIGAAKLARATELSAGPGGAASTLAALRARLAGRPAARPVRNFEAFAAALGTARFPVIVWSGTSGDAMVLDMLQGLVADLNATRRASTLHLPASENGWGAVLAAGWSSGFPPRTSFARGMPDHDPWRFDGARMIASGEADAVLSIGAPSHAAALPHIALAATRHPLRGAAVTFAIGIAGVDHDTVAYRARLGTLGAIAASAPSDLPSAAMVLRGIVAACSGARSGAAA